MARLYPALVLILIALWLIVAAAPVLAQTGCLTRQQVIDRIGTRHGEVVRFSGINRRGEVVEVWAAPGTGSWTLFATTPHGCTRVLQVGWGFNAHRAPEPGQEL